MSEPKKYDVVIVGSGFGGSLLATILSREGMSVAMVDSSRHPRFAIGESSTPAANLLLQELATRHRLSELQPLVKFGAWRHARPRIQCGCKRGFSYFWHAGAEGFQASPNHRHELLVAANSSRALADTQWYRPDVDQFLHTVAQHAGVAAYEEAEVIGVEHARPHDWTMAIQQQETRPMRLHANFAIDASGPAGALMRRLSLDDCTHRLRTRSAAVYSHFDEVRPIAEWLEACGAVVDDHPYPCQDSVIHHLFSDGWLWQINFANGLTSLGYVFAGDAPEKQSASEQWSSLLRQRPALEEILGKPRLARFPNRLYTTGRLQRLWSTGAADDWAALPFAVGFVDPLHSTGIAHTLSGVERLSRILLTTSSRQRSQSLDRYSESVVCELLHIDRLVSGCYASLHDFRLFTSWSMLYFAAATTFERRWLANPANKPGIFCADDEPFVDLVRSLAEELESLLSSCGSADDAVSAFGRRVREAVRPYNHVGLFEPDIPNMYYHTAVENAS